MASIGQTPGPRRFHYPRYGSAVAPALILLILLLEGMPASGGVHLAAPISSSVTLPAPTASAATTNPSIAPAAIAQCGGSGRCGAVSAAPHPSVNPPPRWTDLQSKISNQVPAYRYLASVAYDPIDGYVVLFGGYGNGSGTPYSDTWAYSDGHWRNLQISGPGQRYAAMMTWDARDGYVLLFGGYDSSTGLTYNDTWSFVGGVWNQILTPHVPTARWRAAMAFDAADNYTVMFGGTPTSATTSPQHDTWMYANGDWTNLTKNVTGTTTTRFRQDMTYDAADREIVMFGGCTNSACATASQDTVVYSNLTWTLLAPTSKPPSRAYMGLSYDAGQGYVLLFAGDDYATNTGKSDTWSFLNNTWNDLSGQFTTQPGTRAFEMLTYDGADGYSVLFGGQNPATVTYYNDTWAFGPSVIAHFTASPTTFDLGQRTLLNATPFAFAGYATFNYSGLPPGCSAGNVSSVVCIPTAIGEFNVSVAINDSTGFPTTKSVTLVVSPDMSITGISASPSTVTVGTRLYVNVSATSGTPPYFYSYSGLPGGCNSANTASLGCTPSAAGTFVVAASVTDTAGFNQVTHVNLTVNPSPALSSFVVRPGTIDLGEHFTLWANASGGTAPLSYAYSNLPLGCASVNAPTLSCTPTATGPFALLVAVTDSFGFSASTTTSVTVNPAPAIDGFAVEPGTIDLGQSVAFWLNASSGTGALSLAYSGMPPGCNLGRLATGTCTPTSNGTFVITGTATDTRGIVASQTVTLIIVSDPSIDAVTASPQRVDAGQNATITVAVSGGTLPITYTYTGLPTGCTNTTTSVVTCRPRTAGQYAIVAQISDAYRMTSQLAGSLVVNAAPSVSAFSASVTSVTVGGSTMLQVSVAGGSGVYTYVYTGLPGGCATANSSSLTCTPTATGTFNVSVKVTDSLGLSATSSTQFDVQAAPSTSGFLGFSGSTGYLLIGVIVLVVVIALAALMMMRRRPKPAPTEPAPEWSEPAAEGPTN